MLANRLSANPENRLLLEAGGRDDLYCIDNPRTDYGFRIEAEYL